MIDFKIDIVIISDAKTYELKKLTEQALNTAGNHNFIVVESNNEVFYDTPNTKTIHPNESFGYNKYLNLGAKHGNAEYIFFANNDLIFEKNWDIEIIKEMKKNNYFSASPICPKTHSEFEFSINSGNIEGYEIRKHFCGWAFMWTRSLFNEVGGFDEDFIFWCSDNAAIEQLKNVNKKHALVTSSIVNHITSITRDTLEKKLFDDYTKGELIKFNKKYSKNIIVPGFN